MARNDETKVRYGRRGMLARMGASGIAVAVPAACGSNTEDKGTGTEPLNPIASGTGTGTGTTSTTTTTAAPTTTPPGTQLPPTSTPTQTTTAAPTTTPPATTTTPPTQSTTATPTTSNTPPEASDPAPTMSATTEPTDPPPQGSGGAGDEPPPEVDAGGAPPTSGEVPAPPPWDDVPVCTASPSDNAGQGPFFIHEEEKDDDVSMFRQDIRGQNNPDAEKGIEMHLHLRILNSTSDACAMTPAPDLDVYIWHTDAQGFYSGFGMPGDQKPDEPYAGTPSATDLDTSDRFCRGAQVTNADGVVSFKSVFPGWYNGRDVHIHVVILRAGSTSLGRTNDAYRNLGPLTTQTYFERDFTDSVHKSAEPYKRRTMLSAYEGAIDISSPANSGLVYKAKLEGGIVTAQMQILLDPMGMGSPPPPGGGGGFGGGF